jgi:hypothetical protein
MTISRERAPGPSARRVPVDVPGDLDRTAPRGWRDPVTALSAWAGLVVVAVLWGRHLLPGGMLNVNAPPFLGHYRWAPADQLPALAVAAAGVLALPVLARRLRWRLLLLAAWLAAVAWAVALGLGDGHPTLGGVLAQSGEYLPAVGAVGSSPGAFLSGFADAVAEREYPVHVNGHPPLMVLVLWAWERLGAAGPDWAAALVIAVGASAVPAVATTLRAVAGEAPARRAVPFLAIAPFAITVATSADAFFLGVTAWAAAALAAGLGRRSWPLLSVAGLLIGAVPYLSYGLLPFGGVLLAVAVLVCRRDGLPVGRTRTAMAAALVGGWLLVPGAMTVAGFWWFDGVLATHAAWAAGRGDDRPYLYSYLADFAVLAVLVGPATVVAAYRRPRGATGLLALASLVAVLSLATAGVTRLEVERIWLPFAPWLVVLTASLGGRVRPWLAANALAALAFQASVLGGW